MLQKILQAIRNINQRRGEGFQSYLNYLHSSGLRYEPTVDEAKVDYHRALAVRRRV